MKDRIQELKDQIMEKVEERFARCSGVVPDWSLHPVIEQALQTLEAEVRAECGGISRDLFDDVCCERDTAYKQIADLEKALQTLEAEVRDDERWKCSHWFFENYYEVDPQRDDGAEIFHRITDAADETRRE